MHTKKWFIRLSAALACLLLFTAPNAAPAVAAVTTRYVETTGTDVNNSKCRQSKPCRTLVHAVAIAQSGDTIQLGKGSFFEHVIINKTLVIKGQSRFDTAINGSGTGRVFLTTVQLTLRDLLIGDGSSATGAGIYNSGKLTLKNVGVSHNNATNGAAIYNSGVIKLVNSVIDLNQASNAGAGLFNTQDGKATLKKSTIALNDASLTAGIINGGTLIIKASSIFGNTSSSAYQEIQTSSGTVKLTNSTITSSTYNNTVSPGGMQVTGGSAQLINVTLTGNSTANGGALELLFPASAALKNTILINESWGTACQINGTIDDQGYNLSDDATCGLSTAKHDRVGVNPLLGVLTSGNGGPTLTRALAPTSPAIDKGTNAGCPTSDQRGFARPVDGDANGKARCDIGAFEYVP